MADTILTIQQIEDLLQDFTRQMLGLNPTAPGVDSRVRIGWPDKGAPGWKRNEDVAFLMVTPDDDAITRQREIAYTPADALNADRSMSYTRVIRASWICYGPNSFEDADRLLNSLFLPEIKELLAVNNMALILDTPAPVRSPELFNGQWWARTSFYVRFNEIVTRHSLVPYLLSADVQTEKG